MFLAILSTIITGFSNIYWTRSLGYGVGAKMHDLLSYPVGLFVVAYFIYVGINFSTLDTFLFISTVIILIIAVFNAGLYQKIYKMEKISAIIPYTNLNKILIIISSFFIFADVSIKSLLITILAIIVIILFSIDLKKIKITKTLTLITIAESISAVVTVWSGYLILNYGEDLYFIIFLFTGIIFLSILSYFLGQYKTIKSLDKKFWIYRYIGSAGWISRFLSLLVIKNLGLSVTILLSFLGIGITLFLSYIILNDKPSKKNLLLTFIVTTLVGIGFLLK